MLVSTSEVYGDAPIHPQRETYWGIVNPIGRRSVYDESKRYAEALTIAYERVHVVNVGIVRIFNTYGPGMRPHDGRVVTSFMTQALMGTRSGSTVTAPRPAASVRGRPGPWPSTTAVDR